MRKSFDTSVPIGEQLARGSKTVSTGRKHQKRPGPGKPRKKADPKVLNRQRKHLKATRAYWRGDTDECP